MKAFKSSALALAAAALMGGGGGSALAAPLDLHAVVQGDVAQITLSVGSLAELFGVIESLSVDTDAALAAQGSSLIGMSLTFWYDPAAWVASPFVSGSAALPFGTGTINEESDAGPRFGLSLGSYSVEPMPADGMALLSFKIKLPDAGLGELRLVGAKFAPYTNEMADGLPESAGLPGIVVGVPEPSTYGLMMLGLAGLGMLASRRRQRA